MDGVEAALAATDATDRDILTLDLPEGARAWAPHTQDERVAVRAHVHAALRTRDRATIAGALAQLQTWAGQDGRPSRPTATARSRPIRARRLATAGSLHRAGPRPHAPQPRPRARTGPGRELTGSADDLASWLGEAKRPRIFSYLFGVPGVDVDHATKAAARAAGYTHATVNAPGLVDTTTDPVISCPASPFRTSAAQPSRSGCAPASPSRG